MNSQVLNSTLSSRFPHLQLATFDHKRMLFNMAQQEGFSKLDVILFTKKTDSGLYELREAAIEFEVNSRNVVNPTLLIDDKKIPYNPINLDFLLETIVFVKDTTNIVSKLSQLTTKNCSVEDLTTYSY